MKVSTSRRWFLKALGLTAAAPKVTVFRAARKAAVASAPAWSGPLVIAGIPVLRDIFIPRGQAWLVGGKLLCEDPSTLTAETPVRNFGGSPSMWDGIVPERFQPERELAVSYTAPPRLATVPLPPLLTIKIGDV